MARRAPRLSRYKAEHILELTGSYDYAAFQKAYRAAVVKAHPDVGGDPEQMVRVNEAKVAIDYYFGDDKKQLVTCLEQDVPETTFKNADADPETAAAVNDFVDTVSGAGKFNEDAPYTDNEYTNKNQDDWTDLDWEAFKNFQPPRSFESDSDYFQAHFNKYDTKSYKTMDAENVDVSSWKKADWYHYWLVNNRNKRTDGKVYVSKRTVPLKGAYAERARFEKMPGYSSKCHQYHIGGDCVSVETPYGKVDALGVDRLSWVGNVGVPFPYAMTNDYDLWLKMNYEAQLEALHNKGYYGSDPIASVYGWTGTGQVVDSKTPIADPNNIYAGDPENAPVVPVTDSGVTSSDPDTFAGKMNNVATPEKMATMLDDYSSYPSSPAKFIYKHTNALTWVLLIVIYLWSLYVGVPVCLGYPPLDTSWYDTLGSSFGLQILAMVVMWLPVTIAFFFRKKVVAMVQETCKKIMDGNKE